MVSDKVNRTLQSSRPQHCERSHVQGCGDAFHVTTCALFMTPVVLPPWKRRIHGGNGSARFSFADGKCVAISTMSVKSPRHRASAPERSQRDPVEQAEGGQTLPCTNVGHAHELMRRVRFYSAMVRACRRRTRLQSSHQASSVIESWHHQYNHVRHQFRLTASRSKTACI